LPAELVLDGEVIAFRDGVPHFPDIVARVLHGDGSSWSPTPSSTFCGSTATT
jgi:ATP-dependent DNA ligase